MDELYTKEQMDNFREAQRFLGQTVGPIYYNVGDPAPLAGGIDYIPLEMTTAAAEERYAKFINNLIDNDEAWFIKNPKEVDFDNPRFAVYDKNFTIAPYYDFNKLPMHMQYAAYYNELGYEYEDTMYHARDRDRYRLKLMRATPSWVYVWMNHEGPRGYDLVVSK